MAAFMRTVVQKLGIKPGFKIQIINPPAGYTESLGKMPERVDTLPIGSKLDLVQFFCSNQQDYLKKLPVLKKLIKQNGQIWICWPKKSAQVETDLDENIVRAFALDNQLVDIKVIAIDGVWSGLKLVIPLKFRK